MCERLGIMVLCFVAHGAIMGCVGLSLSVVWNVSACLWSRLVCSITRRLGALLPIAIEILRIAATARLMFVCLGVLDGFL